MNDEDENDCSNYNDFIITPNHYIGRKITMKY